MILSLTVTNFLGESIRLPLDNPYETGLAITSITGIGPAKATINTTDLAVSDGAIYNSARVGTRNIVITFRLLEDPLTNLVEDTRQRTYKYFPLKKIITLLFETDNRLAEIQGYVESNEPDIFQKEETAQISIICPSPYFYSPNSVIVLNGVQPKFEFAFSNESLTEPLLNFGEIVDRNSVSYNYTGNIETGVLFHIFVARSPLTKLSLSNITTNTKMDLDLTKIGYLMGDQAKLPTGCKTDTGDNKAVVLNNTLYFLGQYYSIYKYNNDTNKWSYYGSLSGGYSYPAYLFTIGSTMYGIYGQNASTYVIKRIGYNASYYVYQKVSNVCVSGNMLYLVCGINKTVTLPEAPDESRTYTSYSKVLRSGTDFNFSEYSDLPFGLSDSNVQMGNMIAKSNDIHFLGFNGMEQESSGGVCVEVSLTEHNKILTMPRTPLFKDWGHVEGADWWQYWSKQYTSLIYRDEIHILGGYNGRGHYKWNGTSWTQVSTLPDLFCCSAPAVVFQDEIHLFGGFNLSARWVYSYHYKWDGNSWTKLSDVPYICGVCYPVVADNAIHLIGSNSDNVSNRSQHYKWDGRVWTRVSTLPVNTYPDAYAVFTFKNKIYLGIGNDNLYYTWSGSAWVQNRGDHWFYSQYSYIEQGDKLYVGYKDGNVGVYDQNIKQDAFIYSNWYNVDDDVSLCKSRNMIIYKGHIILLDCVGFVSLPADPRAHAVLSNGSLTFMDDLPYDFTNGASTIHNDEIHIFGGEGNPRAHYKWDGTEWVMVSILPYDFIKGSVESSNGKIHLLGGINHLYDHYIYENDEWAYNRDASIHAGDNIYLSTIAGNRYIKGIREGKEHNLLPALSKNTDWITMKVGDNNILYQTNDPDEEKNVVIEIASNNLYEGV